MIDSDPGDLCRRLPEATTTDLDALRVAHLLAAWVHGDDEGVLPHDEARQMLAASDRGFYEAAVEVAVVNEWVIAGDCSLIRRILWRPDLRIACPVCGEDAMLVRSMDRFVHTDGSSNHPCWLATTRGEVIAGEEVIARSRVVGRPVARTE